MAVLPDLPTRQTFAITQDWMVNGSTDARVAPERIEKRYLLGATIGEGGFGAVYQATDEVTGEQVAIKLLHEATPSASTAEAALLRALVLPGVVPYRHHGVQNGIAYLVMDLVTGRAFPGSDTLTWAQLAGPFISLLETISRVHDVGVLHRDLKPHNVLVSSHDRVTVLDFGIASSERLGFGLNAQGEVRGSPGYLAPEQFMGLPANARSDIYSLGIMAYEALTGELPFADTALDKLVTQRLTTPIVPIASLAPHIPTDVARVIDSMVQLEPTDRPSTVVHILHALRSHHPVHPALPDTDPPRTAKSLRALFVGPDRLLHLREDAADALWTRTLGLPVRVNRELARWVRTGLATPEEQGVVIDRAAIEHLATGAYNDPAPPAPPASVSDLGLDVLEALTLAQDPALPVLAEVSEQSIDAVQAGLYDLEDADVVRMPTEQHPMVILAGAHRWSHERRMRARSRLVAITAPGAPGRFERLLALGMVDEAMQDALAVGMQGLMGQHPERAWTLCSEALRLALSRDDDSLIAQLAERTLLIALERTRAGDLRELARTLAHAGQAALAAFALAAADAQTTGGADHVETLRAFPSLPSEALETWRHVTACYAAAKADLEVHRAAVQAFETYAATSPAARGRLTAVKAALARRQGRYEDAVVFHERARRGAPPRRARGGAINQVESYMSMGRLEEALELVQQTLPLARQARDALHEGYLTYQERTLSYRLGHDVPPDAELIDAASHLGVGWLGGLFELVDLSGAWRRGQNVAERAVSVAATWDAAGRPDTGAVLRALAYHQRGLGDPQAILATAKAGTYKDMCLETVALLAHRGGVDVQSLPLSAWRKVLPHHLDHRMVVLSPREVDQLLFEGPETGTLPAPV